MKYKDNLILNFTETKQLQYMDDEIDYIKLYLSGNFVGELYVYIDWENEKREYIVINYTIEYLDTLEEIHTHKK